MMDITRDTLKRFWYNVDKLTKNECWNWLASKKDRGYGRFVIGAVQEAAHRVSWVIHYGQIPNDLCICHRCDNPSCVNPSHLFLGTHADNMLDMKLKDRAIGHIGEDNNKSTLLETEIIELRKIYDFYVNKYGLTKKLSHVYNVPYGTMQKVVRRYTWNHI